MSSLRHAAATLLLASLGCAESMREDSTRSVAASRASAPTDAFSRALSDEAVSKPADAPKAGATPAPVPEAAPARKIIYNAAVDLIVEDFSTVEDSVPRLARMHEAYVADMEIQGSSGGQRRGQWKVRVPVDQFEPFLAEVLKLGLPTKNHRDSQDVSDRFYDAEARVKNKKVEEARLIKLLEEVGGKLEEILTVERELSRVRGEIEGLQGTLRVLSNLSSLTTVTIVIQERKDYVPPAAPTFATKISRTFHDSLDVLIGFGKSVVLFAVALAPWLPLILVVAGIVWLFTRRRRRYAPVHTIR